jgi:hypothetical protein
MPPTPDMNADGDRGCFGPIPAARTRSKNSEPFRRLTTMKSVTDPPFRA